MVDFSETKPREVDKNTKNLTSLKVPPHSVEAEQAVLGGLMLENSEWDNVVDILLPEDFYRPEHQLIFQVMIKQSEASRPIDVVTLVESLDSLNELEAAGGLDYLSDLASGSRGTANIKAYSEIIRESNLSKIDFCRQ